MNFQDLHELLRVELLRRIERGTLTGSRLAQQAGFQQAHISNFLNRKRALSLEGLDRVLASQNLTIDQILPLDISRTPRTPRSNQRSHRNRPRRLPLRRHGRSPHLSLRPSSKPSRSPPPA